MAGRRRGVIQQVTPFQFHGENHLQIVFRYDDDEEGSARQVRLVPSEAYDGIAPGDRVYVHSVMNMVTRLEKAED